jgi:hypothetical protein
MMNGIVICRAEIDHKQKISTYDKKQNEENQQQQALKKIKGSIF